jgi:rhodanese-related sulfurtransferase
MAFQFGAALAAFLAASGGTVTGAPPQPVAATQQVTVPTIEPSALKALMNSPVRYVLVDVRQPEEFAQGHIQGATLMPLGNLPASYTTLPKNVKLVVYCRSGARSAKAVTFLLAHGYDRAVSLNGGYTAWSAQVK